MTFFQKNKNIFILLTAIIFLFFDLKHSSLQYSKTPLDGDFANIVLPVSGYQTVLSDPLALRVLIQQEKYPATNRFTAHFLMKVYFDNVPFWFQNIYNPIDSLYASITLAKMLIHIGFSFILSLYLATYFGFSYKKLVVFSAIISPFLIVNGPYYENIAFIDFSITYAFFYTLPIIFLMMIYFPIYKYILGKEDFKKPIFYYLIAFPLILFLVLFGPLNAPLIFLINGILFLFFLNKYWGSNQKSFSIKTVLLIFKDINKTVLYFLILGSILSLYSIYIGLFNTENDWCILPLIARFKVLPVGIYNSFFTTDIGAFWMVFLIIINTFLILTCKPKSKKALFKLYFFLLLFMISYCLLLPFGGCRSYRPFILRHDTFVPNLLVLLFLIAFSSYLAITIFKKQGHIFIYLIFFGSFCFHFLKYDGLPQYTNDNEKKAIWFISQKSYFHQNIEVPYNCPIVSWSRHDNYEQSKNSSLILYKYGITKKAILFKNKLE